ncbi:hypothetical protein RHGRI_024776 [Rhododendron griersonianum]|uniref:F-box domain-containing protein n=1 Tax=Rhododendron griersonianum TaxID=479676 RepID=A0AAV6J9P3_9ERIC|nr:hypothetical protein RHGRI_024776 [Rhododendron griersonianum]
MKERCKELPEELWESILNRLPHDDHYHDLRFPSLVCKQFLSITNRIHHKFVANAYLFDVNWCEALCRALKRFRELKEIELSHLGDLSDVNYPVLKIAYSGFYGSSGNSAFPFDDMDTSATGLRELDIGGSGDQERLLCSIAKAGIPLEKLSLRGPLLYQRHELTTLFRAFPTLKHVKVRSGYSINGNDKTREICRCLPNIEYIELDGFYSLTAITFSVLAKECPMLSEIKLRNGYMSLIEDDFVMNLERNYRVIYLDLSYTSGLTDKLLKDIVVACPNLHTLVVGGRDLLTTEGLEEILKSCPQIKHLKSTKYVEILSKAFAKSKLNLGNP